MYEPEKLAVWVICTVIAVVIYHEAVSFSILGLCPVKLFGKIKGRGRSKLQL